MTTPESFSSAYAILDIEIDRGWDPLLTVSLCYKQTPPIPLYKYHEVPIFLRDNPYVKGGYRPTLPFSACIKSLFAWSNETINIWSHLLGFIFFFLLMIWNVVFYLPSIGAETSDYLSLSVGLICFQFCMLCSSGYHLFKCHSERASWRWLGLDLAGISIGILGIYLPGVHFAFYCLSIWRDVYLLVIAVLFVAVLSLQTQPLFLSHAWFHRRLALYVALCAYGVLPSLHWVYLSGGLQAPLVQTFLPKVIILYGLMIVAFLFYISKWPECCCPGSFDYAGASHQWWHILIVAAFYWWYRSGMEIMQFMRDTPCHS